jgi:ubiquinone/menaquinone biosynthesis C-methylase UbiE
MQQWNQKRGNISHYDQQAQIYNTQYHEEQNAKIKTALKNIQLSTEETVLDLGCGTGFLFEHLAHNVGLLVGVDVSLNVLLEAKKRAKNSPNIYIIRADADNTPFVNGCFDKVFSITVIQNMPEPLKTILEIKRVSKHCATFVVTGLKKKFTQESFVELLKAAQLTVVTLDCGEHLKCFVAVCTNAEPIL